MGLINAAPPVVNAQGSLRVRRIGTLEAGTPGAREAVAKRMAPLAELGWFEGKNLHVERRYANGRLDELFPLAEGLVRAQVEIIVANGPNPTRAAMLATRDIPIVFMGANDPVGSGLVASLARPGGNVTGVSGNGSEVTAKLLSLLNELLSPLQRIGVLLISSNPQSRLLRIDLERTCLSAGIEPIFMEVGAVGEIDGAVEQMARKRVQALLPLQDAFVGEHRVKIISAALRHGLPTAGPPTSDGAVLAYTVSGAERERLWSSYVNRILRGAKPADLPVEQATRFELSINLKTARVLGITVPKSMLMRADEVVR